MDGIKQEILDSYDHIHIEYPRPRVKLEESYPTLSISMETDDFLGERNPWASKDLKQFIFYHCPECDYESPVENDFYLHAVGAHERAKEVFEPPQYCDPLLVDYDPIKPAFNRGDWYVYPDQPPNTVHALPIEETDSTVIEEKHEELVSKEYSTLHLEPLYHNSIEKAEQFIEDLKVPKENIVCVPCKKSFNAREHFDLHQLTVHNWNLFTSSANQIPTENANKKEIKIFQENGKYPCPFNCGASYKVQGNLMSHLVQDQVTRAIISCKANAGIKGSKPRAGRFTCLNCEKVCMNFSVLKAHMKKKHGGINCGHCGSAYSTIYSLKKHIQKNHGGLPRKSSCSTKSVICEHCGKLVKSKMIKRHVDLYHSEGVAMCEECGESFQNKMILSEHKRTKHGLNCDLCGKQFKTKKDLIIHNRNIHQDVSKRFCKVCQKTFANAAELFKHFGESHPQMECPAKLGADLYQCRKCLKILASQVALYTHYKLTHKIRYKGHELLKECDQVPTKCPECQIVSNSYMECVNHYFDTHGIDLHKELKNQGNRDRLLYCLMCDYKTRLTTSYHNHIKLHQ